MEGIARKGRAFPHDEAAKPQLHFDFFSQGKPGGVDFFTRSEPVRGRLLARGSEE